MKSEHGVADIRERALGLLARREHSEQELKAKLLARGADTQTVERVVDRLKADNHLSDQRFADSLVRNRVARGVGPLKIRHELSRKGVAEPFIEEAMAGSGAEWLDVCRAAWERKFKGRPPRDYRQWSRQARFLQGRGFSSEHIRAVLPRP